MGKMRDEESKMVGNYGGCVGGLNMGYNGDF